MPKYNVLVTRDTTESTTVDVVAPDETTARRMALAEVENAAGAFDWVADEGNVVSDPYVTGCEAGVSDNV